MFILDDAAAAKALELTAIVIEVGYLTAIMLSLELSRGPGAAKVSVAAEILDSHVRYAALGRSHQVTKAEWLAGAGAAADDDIGAPSGGKSLALASVAWAAVREAAAAAPWL